jgi:hypothetical protein
MHYAKNGTRNPWFRDREPVPILGNLEQFMGRPRNSAPVQPPQILHNLLHYRGSLLRYALSLTGTKPAIGTGRRQQMRRRL